MDEHTDAGHLPVLMDRRTRGGFLHTVGPTPPQRVIYYKVSRRDTPTHEHPGARSPGELLPLLTPPDGAPQRMMGSGGSDDDWRSSARLATELNLTAVAAHYTRQLYAAGWHRVNGGTSRGVLVWSVWDLADEAGNRWGARFITERWPSAPGVPGAPATPSVYLLELHLLWAGGRIDELL